MGPNYSLIQICTADDEFKKRERKEIFKHIYQTCFRIDTIVNDLGDNCSNVDLNRRVQLVR